MLRLASSLFVGPKSALYAALIFITMTVALSGYGFVTGLVHKNAKLTADNAELYVTVEAQAKAIEAWKKALADYKQAVAVYGHVQQRAAAETRRLNHAFSRHDLPQDAQRAPELVARALNAGTSRSQRLLICASGGPCDGAAAELGAVAPADPAPARDGPVGGSHP